MTANNHPFEDLYAPLRQVPLFQGVDGDTLLVFYVASEELIARPGEVIMQEGDPGNELFVIARGQVDVIVSQGTEHETTIAQLGTNDFFGEMCVIEPTSRSATVIATEITFLYVLKTTTLNKIYQIWPEAQTTIMSNLSLELAKRVQKLDPRYFDRAY
ncbi:MAG: cyclic nucleotide-binding domain-containing protein [Verrucomicrobiota bacterium]